MRYPIVMPVDLATDGEVERPAPTTLSGPAGEPVAFAVDAPGNATDRILLELHNTGAQALRVDVQGRHISSAYGTTAPHTGPTMAPGSCWLLGPFSPGRHADNGRLVVLLAPAAADPAAPVAAAVRAYRWPAS